MMYNNLHRVKGILSAKQGAEIPKFQNSGKIYKRLLTGEEVFSPNGDQGLWFYVDYPHIAYTNVENDNFRQLTSYTEQERLHKQETQAIIDKAAKDNKSVLSMDYAIPGALQTTPDTAVEIASETLKRQQDIQNNLKAELAASKAQRAIPLLQTTTPNDPIVPSRIENIISKKQEEAKTAQEQMQLEQQKQQLKDDKKAQFAQNIGQASVAAINTLGSTFGASQQATDSETTTNITAAYDAAAQAASQMGPYGQMVGAVMGLAKGAGDIIQGITGGTDQVTKTDQWMSSPLFSWNVGIINDVFAKKSDALGVDRSTLATVGSSYGGSAADILEMSKKADKKIGLFAGKERREINADIAKARSSQLRMRGVADTATDQRLAAQSMGEQAGLAYSMMTDGGYNQKYTYAAKHGGLLEWNPVAELEWEPQVELNWELPTFKDGGSVEFVDELEWIPEFKYGGKTEDSDVPETEETTQKNVIPEGALHKNKHHMEHAEGLTKKGIPVVDEDGEQQAEIEHSEIIFTLEVTKKLEEYYEIFYSEESTNKEKEQAALDAGKLLVYQILENTEDRTGLIESCKKGGSLTLKKSTDDLIEEVLEWMPTVVIVETEEPKKESKKEESEVSKKDTKDEIKEMIREVLIELLVK